MILPWVKRTRRRPTGLSVRYHGKRVFIGRLCPDLFVRTCIWYVSRGAVHRSWQTRTAMLAWSALRFCFRSSRSLPLTLFSLQTKICSHSLHLTIGRTKSVGDCRNFIRRGLAFSSVRALCGLPLPGRLCLCSATWQQLINTNALSGFSHKIIILSTSLLRTPSNTNFFYQTLVLVAEYHVHCWQTLQRCLL